MKEATAVSSLQQTEITSESWSEADGFKRGICKETDDMDGITAPDFIHSINMLLGAVFFISLAFGCRGSISLRHPGTC